VRLYRSILFLVLIFPLFCRTGLSAAANGGSTEGGPFHVLAELAPGVPSLSPESYSLTVGGESRESFLTGLDEPAAAPAGERKNGNRGTLMPYLSFTFSRAMNTEPRIDPSRRGEEERALEKFRSLSSSLQTQSYRDSLETMGKIFEPQVNLRIEF